MKMRSVCAGRFPFHRDYRNLDGSGVVAAYESIENKCVVDRAEEISGGDSTGSDPATSLRDEPHSEEWATVSEPEGWAIEPAWEVNGPSVLHGLRVTS